MAQTPRSVVYMNPVWSGHLEVCAIYSETTVSDKYCSLRPRDVDVDGMEHTWFFTTTRRRAFSGTLDDATTPFAWSVALFHVNDGRDGIFSWRILQTHSDFKWANGKT